MKLEISKDLKIITVTEINGMQISPFRKEIVEGKINFEKLIGLLVPPSYYVWGTLLNMQIFDLRFLEDLHVLGSGESKKHKISMVSGCSLVSMLVSL